MKKCPYCAEEILDEAIICRYCNRRVDGGTAFGNTFQDQRLKIAAIAGAVVLVGLLVLLVVIANAALQKLEENSVSSLFLPQASATATATATFLPTSTIMPSSTPFPTRTAVPTRAAPSSSSINISDCNEYEVLVYIEEVEVIIDELGEADLFTFMDTEARLDDYLNISTMDVPYCLEGVHTHLEDSLFYYWMASEANADDDLDGSMEYLNKSLTSIESYTEGLQNFSE